MRIARHPQGPRREPLLRLGFGLALGLAACAAPRTESRPAPVEPTLARIFAEPSLDGTRPSDIAVSADGRFASYRWAPAVEGRAPRSRGALHIVPTSGGEATLLSDVESPLWLPSGARLVWCSERELKSWEAGTPTSSAATLTTFSSPAQSPRLAGNGKFLLVTSEQKTWVMPLQGELPGAPKPIEIREGFSLDRSAIVDGGIGLLLRRRPPRPD